MAMADRKARKTAVGEAPDHFEKMLEKPCPNHGYLVKHLYKD